MMLFVMIFYLTQKEMEDIVSWEILSNLCLVFEVDYMNLKEEFKKATSLHELYKFIFFNFHSKIRLSKKEQKKLTQFGRTIAELGKFVSLGSKESEMLCLFIESYFVDHKELDFSLSFLDELTIKDKTIRKNLKVIKDYYYFNGTILEQDPPYLDEDGVLQPGKEQDWDEVYKGLDDWKDKVTFRSI